MKMELLDIVFHNLLELLKQLTMNQQAAQMNGSSFVKMITTAIQRHNLFRIQSKLEQQDDHIA